MKGKLGGGGPRLDHRGPEVPGRELLAEGLGEGHHPPLRRVVDAAVAPGHAAGNRAHVHNVGHATVAALRRRQEVGQCRVGAVEETEEVEVDHPAPLVGRRPLDRAEEHDPCVVDQGVQNVPVQRSSARPSGGTALVGDVGLVDLDLDVPADARGQVFEAVPPPGGQGQRGPLGGQGQRSGLADPAGGPGDQGHGSFESFGHGPLLSSRAVVWGSRLGEWTGPVSGPGALGRPHVLHGPGAGPLLGVGRRSPGHRGGRGQPAPRTDHPDLAHHVETAAEPDVPGPGAHVDREAPRFDPAAQVRPAEREEVDGEPEGDAGRFAPAREPLGRSP